MSLANILVPNNYDLFFGSLTVEDLTVDNLTVNNDENVGGNIITTGNYTSTNGNITLTNGDLSVGDDITVGGDYTSTSGNIVLTNGNLGVGGNVTVTGNYVSSAGDITLTNGILNVGTFTSKYNLTRGAVTSAALSTSLTAAQTVDGLLSLTTSAAGNIQLPNTTDIITLLGSAAIISTIFTLVVANNSGNNATLLGGAGMTLHPASYVISPINNHTSYFVITSSTTIDVY